MDDRRFDELTRVFAAGVSRRSMMKLLGGAFAGAAVSRPLSAQAEDEPKLPEVANCLETSDCDGDLVCADGACVEPVADSDPDDGDELTPDSGDTDGTTTPPPGEEPEGPEQSQEPCEGEACTADSHCTAEGLNCNPSVPTCCDPFECVGSGICGLPCVGNGEVCPTDDYECCAGEPWECMENPEEQISTLYCLRTECGEIREGCAIQADCCGENVRCESFGESSYCCVLEGGACGAWDDCCPGFTCNASGACVEGSCSENLESCTAGHECCSFFCINGACNDCLEDEEPCLLNSDCCSGDCVEGICQVCHYHGEACEDDGDCCPAFGTYICDTEQAEPICVSCLPPGKVLNAEDCAGFDNEIDHCCDREASFNSETCTCELQCLDIDDSCGADGDCCPLDTPTPGYDTFCDETDHCALCHPSWVDLGSPDCFLDVLSPCCDRDAEFNPATCQCELACSFFGGSCSNNEDCCEAATPGVEIYCHTETNTCDACFATDIEIGTCSPEDPNEAPCCDPEATMIPLEGGRCICQVLACLPVGDVCEGVGGDGACCSGNCEGTCCLVADDSNLEESCSESSQCCFAYALCLDGQCCHPVGTICGRDHYEMRCCDGAECVDDWCVALTDCQGADASCESDDDCCDDYQCVKGTCGHHDVCAGGKDICDETTPCCKGYACKGGRCEPKRRAAKPGKSGSKGGVSTIDTLPSTGSGPERHGSNWLSAALAGGAVAAVARWMARSDNLPDES